MSYQTHRKIKAWKQKQELAQKSREVLRPLREALASIPDPLDLDNLQVLDPASIPDPWAPESGCKTTREN